MSVSCRQVRAIVSRELYSYLASPVAYVFIVFFLGLAGFFTFSLGRFFELDQASLEPFFAWHPWLYMFLVPAIGMRMWAEERRSGTLELLLTMPISPWQAVVGKYLAGCVILTLALVLTFPMAIMVSRLGQPDYGAMASGYLGSLLVAMGFLAIGSLTSSLTRNQVVSFILAWGACLLLILCGWEPVTALVRDGRLLPMLASFLCWYAVIWVGLLAVIWRLGRTLVRAGEAVSLWGVSLGLSLATGLATLYLASLTLPWFGRRLGETPPWVVELVEQFSVTTYYQRLIVGVIDLRAVCYFASLVAFALVGTYLVLQQRRAQ